MRGRQPSHVLLTAYMLLMGPLTHPLFSKTFQEMSLPEDKHDWKTHLLEGPWNGEGGRAWKVLGAKRNTSGLGDFECDADNARDISDVEDSQL